MTNIDVLKRGPDFVKMGTRRVSYNAHFHFFFIQNKSRNLKNIFTNPAMILPPLKLLPPPHCSRTNMHQGSEVQNKKSAENNDIYQWFLEKQILMSRGSGVTLQVPPLTDTPLFFGAKCRKIFLLRKSSIKKFFTDTPPLFFPKICGRGGVSVVLPPDSFKTYFRLMTD